MSTGDVSLRAGARRACPLLVVTAAAAGPGISRDYRRFCSYDRRMAVVRLAFEPDPLPARGPARVELAVVNDGAGPLVLAFATAQRAELVLEDAGAIRYRWSEGRLVAAVLSEVVVEPGAEWRTALDVVFDVPPGAYTLRATVTARAPLAAEARVTLV
jgi:lipoprotein-anchoring transpeptidase ErfK/SrfK